MQHDMSNTLSTQVLPVSGGQQAWQPQGPRTAPCHPLPLQFGSPTLGPQFLVESSAQHRPRVLFLGMQGDFSPPSLRALLDNGIEVCAVVVPASQQSGLDLPAIVRREQPRTTRPILPLLHASILQLAWAQHIPVWEVQRISDSEAISVLASYQPDMICVSCFSQRIPRTVLNLPRLGSLN